MMAVGSGKRLRVAETPGGFSLDRAYVGLWAASMDDAWAWLRANTDLIGAVVDYGLGDGIGRHPILLKDVPPGTLSDLLLVVSTTALFKEGMGIFSTAVDGRQSESSR